MPLVNYYFNISVYFVLRVDVAPTTTSSISCHSCSQRNRELCDASQAVETCGVGEVCRLVVHKLPSVFGGGGTSFQKGCFPKSDCFESDQCNDQSGGDCWRCCDSNLCNNGGLKDFNTGNKTQSIKIFTVAKNFLCFFLYCFYISKYTKLVPEAVLIHTRFYVSIISAF